MKIAFQIFNESTVTLNISNFTEFADDYKDDTKHVVIADGITEIPSEAFY